MTTVISLNRSDYTEVGGSRQKPAIDYLSAKYKNIRFALTPRTSYTVTGVDRANAPGISYEVYGSEKYWWVVCMCNGILNPIEDLVPGMVLQLPVLADINAFLTSQDRESTSDVVI